MTANELSFAFVSAGEVLAANIVLPLVGMTIVGLRFWMRITKRSGLWVDDWLILAALVFVVGMAIAQIYGISQHTVGYPSKVYATPEEQLTSLPPEQRMVELIYWITWILMMPANGLIKLSSIMLYRRLFMLENLSIFGVSSAVTGVICALWTVAFFFATIFGCGTHFSKVWGPLIEIGSCNTNMRLDAMMITDLITNVMVWALPIPVVWSLRISITQKVAVCGVFLLAAISLAASVVRMMIQLQISHGGYAAHTNVNLTLTMLLYWSIIESGLALIACSLPTLRVLFRVPAVSSAIHSMRSRMRNSWRPTQGSSNSSNRNSDMFADDVAFNKAIDKALEKALSKEAGVKVEQDLMLESSSRPDWQAVHLPPERI